MKAVLLAVLSVATLGCYHLTGRVIEEQHIRSTLLDSKKATESIPEKTGVYVDAVFDNNAASLKAERQAWCRETTTSTFTRVSDTRRALPRSHWAVFGTGVAMLAAGCTAAILGNSMISDARGKPIGEPSLERQYDQGRVLFPAGLVGGGIGLLVLGSETYDLARTGDGQARLAPDTASKSSERLCERQPVPGLELTLNGAGKGSVVRADSRGLVDSATLERAIRDLPFDVPFFSVACAQCKPASISLPPAVSATFVINRRNKTDINRWLALHGDTPSAPLVRQALQESETMEAKGEADAARLEGERKLTEGDDEGAERLAGRCLALVPGHAPCLGLQTQARKKIAAATLLSAKRFLASKRMSEAFLALKRCVEVQPDNRECLAMQARIRGSIEKNAPDHVKDLAIYEEGGGYAVYFSLVNKAGEYVATAGQVGIAVSFQRSGLTFYRVPVASFSVQAADFQLRAIGLGGFSRQALIVPKFFNRAAFTANFNPTPGFGPAALEQLARDADQVYLELRMTDVLGGVYDGRTTFVP